MTGTGPLPGATANMITGGVFFSAVIQGQNIQVVLPAEVRPALTGLPPASSVFTGRDDQKAALEQCLRPDAGGGVQLVSAVAGLAGVGKTELVLHTAHHALDAGWFPGGVLFVDLYGYDPQRRLSAAEALGGWLSAIGIPGEHIPATEQDRSRLWRSVLDAYTSQDRRLLLIIDNAAGEDQVRPLLPGDRRTPVLVTSRHSLAIGRRHDLDTLDTTAAVTLIREVVATGRGEDDPRLQTDQHTGLTDLAERCAGLPLALWIVAELLADRPMLQPAVLAERLTDEQTRLDGLTRQDAAVRTAFDLSYQNLTPDQGRLFRLLPVNPGPDIATTSAARLADLPEQQTATLLADLHRAHLITESAPERWGMHDLIRLYATDHQHPDTEDQDGETGQARQRLYTHYRDTTHAASTHLAPTLDSDTSVFPDRAPALAWLDAEHANLIATATTAAPHHADLTCHLTLDLAEYLNLRRHFDDWITITTLARDICQQSGDRHSEGQAWNNLGLALRHVRRFDEAITAHTRARDIYQQTGDQYCEGIAWNNLGSALRDIRRFDEAITAYAHDLEICQQAGNRHGEGLTWNNLGTVLQQMRRFDEAITAHTRARDICQLTGDRRSEGTAWNNLGSVLQQMRRFDEAITAHTRACDIYRQTGDRYGEGQAWNNLGRALQHVRRFNEARSSYQRAVDAFTATGDSYLAERVRSWLAKLPPA